MRYLKQNFYTFSSLSHLIKFISFNFFSSNSLGLKSSHSIKNCHCKPYMCHLDGTDNMKGIKRIRNALLFSEKR